MSRVILKATSNALMSQLYSYANELRSRLEDARYLSADDFKKTHGMALSLMKQVKLLKAESVRKGKDISLLNEKEFLNTIKIIRVRLAHLNPQKQLKTAVDLHTRKIKHHHTESNKFKTALRRLSSNFIPCSKKKRKMKHALLREVKRHDIEKEKSMTRLTALSKHHSVRY